MTIRCFNDKGLQQFINYISKCNEMDFQAFKRDVLESKNFTHALGGDVKWLDDDIDLSNRYFAAKQLAYIVRELGLKSAERNVGFWAWCSAYLFDRLCKISKKTGQYDPGALNKWVPEPDDFQTYYRHYLSSIWRLYVRHNGSEHLKVLLHQKVNEPGNIFEQIASREKLATSAYFQEVLYILYWDNSKQDRKELATESTLRLVSVLNCFEVNYDLEIMTPDKILDLLGPEFDKYKPVTSIEKSA